MFYCNKGDTRFHILRKKISRRKILWNRGYFDASTLDKVIETKRGPARVIATGILRLSYKNKHFQVTTERLLVPFLPWKQIHIWRKAKCSKIFHAREKICLFRMKHQRTSIVSRKRRHNKGAFTWLLTFQQRLCIGLGFSKFEFY